MESKCRSLLGDGNGLGGTGTGTGTGSSISPTGLPNNPEPNVGPLPFLDAENPPAAGFVQVAPAAANDTAAQQLLQQLQHAMSSVTSAGGATAPAVQTTATDLNLNVWYNSRKMDWVFTPLWSNDTSSSSVQFLESQLYVPAAQNFPVALHQSQQTPSEVPLQLCVINPPLGNFLLAPAGHCPTKLVGDTVGYIDTQQSDGTIPLYGCIFHFTAAQTQVGQQLNADSFPTLYITEASACTQWATSGAPVVGLLSLGYVLPIDYSLVNSSNGSN